MYYLQSRYYDPEVGRFLNADALVLTAFGLVGINQFVYCINNPIRYHDSNGNMPEEDCVTGDPEEILFPDKDAVGAPTGTGMANSGGSQGAASPSGGTGDANTQIPQHAWDTLNHIQSHGEAPNGYHWAPYSNDGRSGTQVLPPDSPYYEYDVHPFIPGVNRGMERIVIGASGTAWYTWDHYFHFIRME